MKKLITLLGMLVIYLYAMFHGAMIFDYFGKDFIFLGWLVVAIFSTTIIVCYEYIKVLQLNGGQSKWQS